MGGEEEERKRRGRGGEEESKRRGRGGEEESKKRGRRGRGMRTCKWCVWAKNYGHLIEDHSLSRTHWTYMDFKVTSYNRPTSVQPSFKDQRHHK